jgi:hypothetical protein
LNSSPPVGVFAHRRADLLRDTLDALAACNGFRGARVHVYCDAASDADAARAVAIEWCRRFGARLVLRDTNRGFRNITDGITELCDAEGWAISLEDDHCADRRVLEFLDHSLARYRDEPRVFQVAASLPGRPLPASAPDTFFLPAPMAMGWGTWQRAWSHFSWEIEDAVLAESDVRERFDLGGSYPATALLNRAQRGEFDSYFIRWYLAMFRAGGLALCSRRALVRNTGLGSGVHGMAVSARREQFFNANWRADDSDPHAWSLPDRIDVDPAMLAHFMESLRTWVAGR